MDRCVDSQLGDNTFFVDKSFNSCFFAPRPPRKLGSIPSLGATHQKSDLKIGQHSVPGGHPLENNIAAVNWNDIEFEEIAARKQGTTRKTTRNDNLVLEGRAKPMVVSPLNYVGCHPTIAQEVPQPQGDDRQDQHVGCHPTMQSLRWVPCQSPGIWGAQADTRRASPS